MVGMELQFSRLGLAQLAYERYGEQVGWLNYAGLPMPKWNDLGTSIQDAWREAAGGVAETVAGAMHEAGVTGWEVL